MYFHLAYAYIYGIAQDDRRISGHSAVHPVSSMPKREPDSQLYLMSLR
jgi:hypothetical protein